MNQPSARANLPLMILTGFLVLTGLVLVFSAGRVTGKGLSALFVRQFAWCIAGFACLAAARLSKHQTLTRNAPLLFVVTLLLLVVVFFLGQGRAQRWLRVGGFFFQPSEFAKLVFIFTLAWYLEKTRRHIGRFTTLLGGFLFVLAPPMLLILLQPNLGTAFILLPVFFAMFYIAGAPRKHLAALCLFGLSAMPVFWLFLKTYQKQRILVFLNPGADPLGAGYNIIQSRIAIGSGGLWGKGFLRGTQTHLAFLPEHHTDFIFSVLAEEWGLLGGAVVLTAYLLFLNRIVRAALLARDHPGTTIAIGCAAMFATQIVVNIAMTMGFLPVVGIPLPFLSYGGSSLLVSMTAVGVVLGIGRTED